MTPAQRAVQKSTSAAVWWLVLLLFPVPGIIVWSNHFQNQFHDADFPAIVNNPAIHAPADLTRLFREPRTFSVEPEYADYRPVLSASYALDAWLSPLNNPLVFQVQSFLWFGLLILALYMVFRLIPGTGHYLALFAAGLVSVHPVAAETVNYISQRGQIMGAAGVSLALALWIIWPRRLPRRLPLLPDRVPQNWWQQKAWTHGPLWQRWYKRLLRWPLPFYLIPLVPALLAEPSAAMFALLLWAYAVLYDSEAGYLRLLFPTFVCAGYWLVQSAVVWRVSPMFRIPAAHYWLSQPWVAMRYLGYFFLPGNLGADAGLRPLAGGFGVLALAVCAVLASRSKQPHARGVAFGLWWFLAALLPAALLPQRDVEAIPRMFPAVAGLAFAVAQAGGLMLAFIAGLKLKPAARAASLSALGALFLAVPCVAGWMTYQRNQVWATELTLWQDVAEKNPENARGLVNYAAALAAAHEGAESLRYLRMAVPLAEGDGVLQLRLAQGFDRLNLVPETEFHFRQAVRQAPEYSAVHSRYAQWLFANQRRAEALSSAMTALSLNPADLPARHMVIEFYSLQADWVMVSKLAREVLALDSNDAAAKLSLRVATAATEQLWQAEEDVRISPAARDYLKLSGLYFHGQRFEESIRASRAALQLDPKLAEAYTGLALALHALQRDDEARAALHQAVRLRPEATFANRQLELLLQH